MYVRLAFAVAAHLEPEILVVDEVLAVGDAEFQKKCLGKMKDVATGGRTVLFVSHNMGAVSSLCENILHLSAGKVLGHGGTQEQISTYLRQKEKCSLKANGPLAEYVGIQKIVIHKKTMFAKKPPTIEATVEYEIRRKVDSFRPFLGISQMGIRICTWEGNPTRNDAERGLQQITFKIPISYLKNGIYSVSVGAISKDKINWVWVEDAENIEVFEHDINDPNQIRDGLVYLPQGD
jgi:lipopolysaccharide transport system ATP-binding protein